MFLTLNTISANSIDEETIIDPVLIDLLNNQKKVDCLISFDRKANVYPANFLKTKKEKGQYVYNALKKVRDESQENVIAYLESEQVLFSSYFIVNAIAAKLSRKQIIEIAEFQEIKAIVHDPSIRKEKHIEEINHPTKELPEPEWGIKMIQADSVWRLGFEGEGVVIGGQDTGFEWEHSALKSKYRGQSETDVDHNYNWHDAIREINGSNPDSINPCGLNSPFPCDDNNHGTHTMGTMVGSDSLNSIGVAPRAKWIACRNMERGVGKPSTYIECFEWFLAPTDLNNELPNPNLAPDVINNSWSCPESEGCNETNWELMEDAIVNLKVAGIVVIVSAGNEGRDGCGSVARAPAFFESSFAIGATMANDTIANFSSRGPVNVDLSFRLKPDVSAPGHNVRSSIRNGEFRNFSGTSMAGPHVVGAVALIINANPDLRGQVRTIEDILFFSAEEKLDDSDCFDILGQGVPNHVYGNGRINVLEAVETALNISSVENNISLLNLEGKLLKVKANSPKTLNLNGLNKGMYLLKLESKKGTAFERLIIGN